MILFCGEAQAAPPLTGYLLFLYAHHKLVQTGTWLPHLKYFILLLLYNWILLYHHALYNCVTADVNLIHVDKFISFFFVFFFKKALRQSSCLKHLSSS